MGVRYGDVFDAVVRAVDPGEPALRCVGAAMTWGVLEHATKALARALIAASFAPAHSARDGVVGYARDIVV
jgi:hypothetical protein